MALSQTLSASLKKIEIQEQKAELLRKQKEDKKIAVIDNEPKTQIVFEIVKGTLSVDEVEDISFDFNLGIMRCNHTGYFFAPISKAEQIKDIFTDEIKYSYI